MSVSIVDEFSIFESITEEMNKVFRAKRQDYGQTSTETFKKFGPISMYIRMYDKMGRLENLMVKGGEDHVGEKIEDTLLDLANYAIITILEMHKAEIELRGDTIAEEVDGRRCRETTTTLTRGNLT